jgi:transposase
MGLTRVIVDGRNCFANNTRLREVKVASEYEVLLTVLKKGGYQLKRIGLEAGPLSQWLFSALGEAGLPLICVEKRHMRAILRAQINKTDRNDARGIAQIISVQALTILRRGTRRRTNLSASIPIAWRAIPSLCTRIHCLPRANACWMHLCAFR